MTEPPLPKPFVSALRIARDQVVAEVEAWSIAWRKGPTIGHAGKVTQEFLITQGGMAPRSVISVMAGIEQRLGGGASTLCEVEFHWYLILRGRLIDRTVDALDMVGEAGRLVIASPWYDPEDPAAVFCKTPTAGSSGFKSLYLDKDEGTGISIWGRKWFQAIRLGTAQRAKTPAAVPLVEIDGTDTIDGDPNGDTLETKVA